jgi:hypothetical protein
MLQDITCNTIKHKNKKMPEKTTKRRTRTTSKNKTKKTPTKAPRRAASAKRSTSKQESATTTRKKTASHDAKYNVDMLKIGLLAIVMGTLLFLGINYVYIVLPSIVGFSPFELYAFFIVGFAGLCLAAFFITQILYILITVIWDSILQAPHDRKNGKGVI